MHDYMVPLIVSGIVIAVIGVILNLLVFGLYIGKKSIPRSFANKLLLHQCFVDLVNLVVLILPYTCRRLHLLLLERSAAITYDEYLTKVSDTISVFYSLVPLSTLSSAFTFTLEAIDRLLANHSKEIHQKFTKRKIITPTFIIIWTLSVVCSAALFLAFYIPSWNLFVGFWIGLKHSAKKARSRDPGS